ncbi:hypothetical protein HID58_013576, partial [Brassica napus]
VHFKNKGIFQVVEHEDNETWLTIPQNKSPLARKTNGKATQRPEVEPPTGSPSRYHLLSNELEEGEVDVEEDSSDEESSVESQTALEKKKQMERQKSGKKKKSQKIRIKVQRINKPIKPPHGGTDVMISIFAWNTRGFNKMRKHKAFHSWIQSARPSFGCLVETRVQEVNSISILNSALPNWNFLNNYDHHRLGKIWVCWDDNVSVSLVYKSAQCITVWVTSKTGEQFLCSCVYASNFTAERQRLWSELAQIKHHYAVTGVPWMVMGDFNETLASLEHSLGSFSIATQQGMQAFQSAVVAEATTNWNYWAEIEENFLRQKSRITWLKNGDQNTLFFFKIVQCRSSFNLIRQLILPSGETITDPQLIKITALALQTSIYSIWRERNSRRHQGNPHSAAYMVRVIDKTIKNRISSLQHRKPSFYTEMMQRWLQRPA